MTSCHAKCTGRARAIRASGTTHAVKAIADLRVVAVLIVVADGRYTGTARISLRARRAAARGYVRDRLACRVSTTR